MDRLLASHPLVTDVATVGPKRTALYIDGGRTNWQCLVLIKRKRGQFKQNVLMLCIHQDVYSCYSAYSRNILWLNKITGHTLKYKRSLGTVGTLTESANASLKAV